MIGHTGAMREHWALDPDVVFLNHGSFGACPVPVMEFAAEVRARLEREPVQFFERIYERELATARATLSDFVGADPDDLVFVTNTTSGVSAVLGSLALAPGDAVLTTSHAYGACKNALDFFAERARAEVLVAHVPAAPRSDDEVIAPILEAARAARARVKLALVDHVTSQTGIVFPIATIVDALRAWGIETLVDGAHAPGMVPLSVGKLGAAYYVGNLHKWVCAPKGAALLVVRRDLQARVHPPVISHGRTSRRSRSRFLEEFDWAGTLEPSAWLSVPEAIRFVGGLVPGGWPEIYARNRALALEGRDLVAKAIGSAPGAPGHMIGSLACVAIPDDRGAQAPTHAEEPLHRALIDRHRIEVPVFPFPAHPKRLLRVSAHVYNRLSDFERLAAALRVELDAPS
jgi:isopenicillin-N epimerase